MRVDACKHCGHFERKLKFLSEVLLGAEAYQTNSATSQVIQIKTENKIINTHPVNAHTSEQRLPAPFFFNVPNYIS
jgi:hypothetical protein